MFILLPLLLLTVFSLVATISRLYLYSNPDRFISPSIIPTPAFDFSLEGSTCLPFSLGEIDIRISVVIPSFW
jgi:hypothetical protein